jgi:hypothetical protein
VADLVQHLPQSPPPPPPPPPPQTTATQVLQEREENGVRVSVGEGWWMETMTGDGREEGWGRVDEFKWCGRAYDQKREPSKSAHNIIVTKGDRKWWKCQKVQCCWWDAEDNVLIKCGKGYHYAPRWYWRQALPAPVGVVGPYFPVSPRSQKVRSDWLEFLNTMLHWNFRPESLLQIHRVPRLQPALQMHDWMPLGNLQPRIFVWYFPFVIAFSAQRAELQFAVVFLSLKSEAAVPIGQGSRHL